MYNLWIYYIYITNSPHDNITFDMIHECGHFLNIVINLFERYVYLCNAASN